MRQRGKGQSPGPALPASPPAGTWQVLFSGPGVYPGVVGGVGPRPHPGFSPETETPGSWIPTLTLVIATSCVCTGVTYMHVPVCLGVPWVPIRVLWDTDQCLCWPQRTLAECPVLPPTVSGSAAWRGLGCLCLGLAGCVSLSGSPGPAPPRDLGSLGPALPSQPSRPGGQASGRGGCLAGLPLAEAQVQAVRIAPHTTSPPSWADRKIPDIVVQRWLQPGRQQGVEAALGCPEPPG